MDHFALEEKEAYDCTRNIISTLNFQLPQCEEEETTGGTAEEEPLYSSDELLGFAPRSYNYSLDIKMVQYAVIPILVLRVVSIRIKWHPFGLLGERVPFTDNLNNYQNKKF